MTDSLSLDRFRELADAYGGVISRWPEKHRDAARQMASEPAAGQILAQALVLDETLDAWRAPSATDQLRDRVLCDAPAQRRSFALRARLWWTGVGVAAALAGAVAGAATVAVVAPVEAPSDSATAFGDLAQEI